MNKFKIGDRVKILGQSGWHGAAKRDICKLGTVTEVQCNGYYYGVLVDGGLAYNKNTGNLNKGYSWVVAAEAIKKVEQQMQFSFMYEED